jgi:hypothetical protein
MFPEENNTSCIAHFHGFLLLSTTGANLPTTRLRQYGILA